MKFTTVRVVCNNTLTLALKAGGNEFLHGRAVAAVKSPRASIPGMRKN